MKTRIRASKELIPVDADPDRPIRPKRLMPRADKSSRRKPLYQLIENHMANAPTSDSVEAQKRTKELRK